MTIKSIVKMGNKELSTPSLEIKQFTAETLRPILKDMEDTMKAKDGVGIAAPQIGVNQRIIMFGFEKSERYPNEKPVPFTILINPEYKPLSDEIVDGWERCLSIPGLRGLVSRYNKIQYNGF